MESLRVGRNEACPCGSGRKFKVCCLRRQTADQAFRPPPMAQPQPVFSDGAAVRPQPQLRPIRPNGSDQPIKRIPVHYTYPEPFGVAECVYCFPVERLIVLTNGNVVLAEWLQPGMQFRMEGGDIGTVTAVEVPKVWEPPSRIPDQNGRYLRRVLGTIKHKGFVVMDITFGGQTVTGTPDHRWYSVSRKAWVPAQTLRRGELLLNGEGSVVAVEAISEPRYGFIDLYNLEVEELHTYSCIHTSSDRAATVPHSCITGRGIISSSQLRQRPVHHRRHQRQSEAAERLLTQPDRMRRPRSTADRTPVIQSIKCRRAASRLLWSRIQSSTVVQDGRNFRQEGQRLFTIQ